MPSSIRNLLHLPSRIALLLGLGALSIAGAKADTGGDVYPDHDGVRVPQRSAKALADLKIWKENGRIYVSETGKPAEELRLQNTADAELLGQLLEGATAAAPRVLRDRIILVGGGGAGTHWAIEKEPGLDKVHSPVTGDSAKPALTTAKPREQTDDAPQSSLADRNSK